MNLCLYGGFSVGKKNSLPSFLDILAPAKTT